MYELLLKYINYRFFLYILYIALVIYINAVLLYIFHTFCNNNKNNSH